jgi:hypothetical protein
MINWLTLVPVAAIIYLAWRVGMLVYLPAVQCGLAVETIIPASIAPNSMIGHSAVLGITMTSLLPGCRPARRRDAANRRQSSRDSAYL